MTARRQRALTFTGLVTTMMVASVNQNAISAALPTIVGELHGVGHMGWVVTSFMLTATISMPIYGRLSDQLGRRSMLLVGVGFFLTGSVIGGLAPTLGWLIAARMVQGVGAGSIIVLAQATVADLVPARDRATYLGWMNGVFTLSWVIGPLVGGGLTEGIGWRWVFWVNLPIGGLAFYLLWRHLRLPPPEGARGRFDYGGITLLSAATTALVLLTASVGAGYEVATPAVVTLVTVLVVGAVLFVLVERRAEDPVVPPALFAVRNFNLVAATSLLTGAVMMAVIAYLPTYLQMVTSASATQAGLWMLPIIGALLVTSILAGSIVQRTGRYRLLPVVGLTLVAAALALLGSVERDTAVPVIGAMLALLGAGLGLTMNVLVLVGQSSFGHAMVGTATSSISFARQIGSALGVAVVGGLFSNRLAAAVAERLPSSDLGVRAESFTPEIVHALAPAARAEVMTAYRDALMPVFDMMAPLALLGALVMFFIVEKPLGRSREVASVPVEDPTV